MALVSLHTLLSAANAPSRVPSKLTNKQPRPDKQHVPAKESALAGNLYFMTRLGLQILNLFHISNIDTIPYECMLLLFSFLNVSVLLGIYFNIAQYA